MIEGDIIRVLKKIFEPLNTNLKRMDKVLLILSLILFIIGTFNIINASSFEVNAGGDLYYYSRKHIFILLSGIVISLTILSVDTKYYRGISILGYAIIFLLVLYCFTQDPERGSQNWIDFGPLSLQPSEFSKPIIIICLARLLSKWDTIVDKKIKVNWLKELGKFIIIAFPIPLMVAKQNDLGSASIILCIECIMFFASKIPSKIKKISLVGIITVVTLLGLSVVLDVGIIQQYQLNRFKSVLTPCSDYADSGYQTCNALIAFNQGCLTGLGIGKSKQKYSYIPEPHTDSVFAIIGEELGFIASTILLLMLFFVIARIYKISKTITNKKGRFVCLGISWYIFIHILLNLGGLMALIPLTGVPLPFFSYGGSYTWCLIASLSIVQKYYIEDKSKTIKIV